MSGEPNGSTCEFKRCAPTLNSLDSELQCAICLNELALKVSQCPSGHLFCTECLQAHCKHNRGHQGAQLCPVCRIRLPKCQIRSLLAERLISLQPAQCKWPGCGWEGTRGLQEFHENSRCLNRSRPCPWTIQGTSTAIACSFRTCGGANSTDDFNSHVASCPFRQLHMELEGREQTLRREAKYQAALGVQWAFQALTNGQSLRMQLQEWNAAPIPGQVGKGH